MALVVYIANISNARSTHHSGAVGIIHQPMRPSVAVRLEGEGPLYAPLP